MNMKDICQEDLKSRLASGEAIQLIDVRSPSEFAAGHIPCAVNIPMDHIEARLLDVDPKRPLIFVCQTGRRAEMTRQLLEGKVAGLVLEGGTKSWSASGAPIVASSRTRWSLERQVRLAAGFLVFTGIMLALTVNPWFLGLSGFVSVGLMFAGITDICMIGTAFANMPWNKAASIGTGETR
ncbi:rhodanese-like domain-containing protein [soil metagenome]